MGEDVVGGIARTRLVPVVVVQDAAAEAEPLAMALADGGLSCAEVTFRTSAALSSLRIMAQIPGLLLGAGTVVSPRQVGQAVAAGAKFIVSPGFSTDVVRECRELGAPVFPGVATATEIQAALEEGLDILKFFPAEPLGGLTMVKALAAPFGGVRFIPTGGIKGDQLQSYLSHPSVLAVGGSWMVAPALVAERRWDSITKLTAEAVATAAATPVKE